MYREGTSIWPAELDRFSRGCMHGWPFPVLYVGTDTKSGKHQVRIVRPDFSDLTGQHACVEIVL